MEDLQIEQLNSFTDSFQKLHNMGDLSAIRTCDYSTGAASWSILESCWKACKGQRERLIRLLVDVFCYLNQKDEKELNSEQATNYFLEHLHSRGYETSPLGAPGAVIAAEAHFLRQKKMDFIAQKCADEMVRLRDRQIRGREARPVVGDTAKPSVMQIKSEPEEKAGAKIKLRAGRPGYTPEEWEAIKQVGKNVNKKRKQIRITQQRLAEHFGKNKLRSIQKILSGETFQGPFLPKIALVLNCSLDEFLDGVPEEHVNLFRTL